MSAPPFSSFALPLVRTLSSPCRAVSTAPNSFVRLGVRLRPPSATSHLLFLRRCSPVVNRTERARPVVYLFVTRFLLTTNRACSSSSCPLFVLSLTAPSWQTVPGTIAFRASTTTHRVLPARLQLRAIKPPVSCTHERCTTTQNPLNTCQPRHHHRSTTIFLYRCHQL